MDEGASTRRWTCRCGETISPPYSHCWRCGAARGDAAAPGHAIEPDPPPPPATDDPGDAAAAAKRPASLLAAPDPVLAAPAGARPGILLEVLAVLALAYLPHLTHALLDFRAGTREVSFLEDALGTLVGSVQVIGPLLWIISRSGAARSTFGLAWPPRWGDLLVAAILYVLHCGVCLFAAAAAEVFTPVEDFELPGPSGTAQLVLMVAAATANAFAEELAMRAYLIPRLEALTNSTGSAIALSSLLFASYHIYQGVGNALVMVAFGLLYGFAFAVTRRIWPLVIAHAVTLAMAWA